MAKTVVVGIAFPFRLGASDIVTATGDELRQAHIGTVLGTRASSGSTIGEYIPDPDRGSALDALRHAKTGPAFEDLAAIYVVDALGQALPDERVVEVGVVVDQETVELTVTTQAAKDASANPRTLVTRQEVRA